MEKHKYHVLRELWGHCELIAVFEHEKDAIFFAQCASKANKDDKYEIFDVTENCTPVKF